MTDKARRSIFRTLLSMSFLFVMGNAASAQGNVDCSAAAQRVVAQTNGELLSVSVANSGGQPVCKITVLANGSDGKRRRRMTVNAKP